MEKNFCFYVPEIPNGDCFNNPGHYYPGIVTAGEPGYNATDWDWGTDKALAQECADQKNERMGINKDEATSIVLSSMFARQIP